MNPFSATKVRPETKEDEEVCVIYCCNIFSCWECEKKERQTECESSAAFPERVLEREGGKEGSSPNGIYRHSRKSKVYLTL